jgi:hypothetical protein
MTQQQLDDALDQVLARTGVARYRVLCNVDGLCSPWDQAGYQALVYILAAIEEPRGHIEVPDCLKLATPAARRHGLTGPPKCGGGSCSPRKQGVAS